MPETYRPGDEANGYRLSQEGKWELIPPSDMAKTAAMPAGTAQSTSATAGPRGTTAKAKSGRGRLWLLLGGGLALFLLGLIIGSAAKGTPTTTAAATTPETVTVSATGSGAAAATVTAPAQTVTVTATPSPPPEPAGPATKIDKDGVYVVGTDIQPGRWRTSGPNGGIPGYFAVLKDPAGPTSDVNNIVTNDNPIGQAFVTLKAGQGFSTQRLTWEKVG